MVFILKFEKFVYRNKRKFTINSDIRFDMTDEEDRNFVRLVDQRLPKVKTVRIYNVIFKDEVLK